MQRSSEIIGFGLRVRDDTFGTIDDVLFNDEHWGLRRIIVDTGTWPPGRKVLLPCPALGRPDQATLEYTSSI